MLTFITFKPISYFSGKFLYIYKILIKVIIHSIALLYIHTECTKYNGINIATVFIREYYCYKNNFCKISTLDTTEKKCYI